MAAKLTAQPGSLHCCHQMCKMLQMFQMLWVWIWHCCFSHACAHTGVVLPQVSLVQFATHQVACVRSSSHCCQCTARVRFCCRIVQVLVPACLLSLHLAEMALVASWRSVVQYGCLCAVRAVKMLCGSGGAQPLCYCDQG